MTRATLDKKPRDVATMFDGVAKRYDLTNSVLSFAQDRRWRRRTRDALGLRPGQRVLDVAAGTGVSTAELARSGAYAVASDFSLGMLRAGARKQERRRLPMVAADALNLPFADGTFDAVTISFGLRNIVDVPAALREFARVTKPGGRLVICEFSTPDLRIGIRPLAVRVSLFRHVYMNYLMRALPWVARRVSSNPDAYVYLAESIRSWPDQAALGRTVAASGWSDVSWRNLTGGIVALHRAQRPEN
ncbi:MAG: demethylmenaquinone methyltransferase / 2-methoxy-6-polyprenyl,4-benzoquinol methylase [Pseudonocardiales bacterium]|jgi:demethylmenaquinone methyltransferase/2-methoxy-6-polyprenyl-1,4-benzoquinol methylase|nr:demethylmenaquinone methyltransferase / 2-methoxy-6-polyprenyl,4-benzoquinol methylase [Pseudonocardiales bacterium]